jgi:hypothetical protein
MAEDEKSGEGRNGNEHEMPEEQAEPTRKDARGNDSGQSPPSFGLIPPELLDRLATRLAQARDAHDQSLDAWLFNGSTALVLTLTAAAAFVPSLNIHEGLKWIAPLCAAVSGVLVATERALGFGARWRYHRDMYYGYSAILDMFEFYPAIPPSEQSKYGRDIFNALYALRSRESAIPNAGANSAPT